MLSLGPRLELSELRPEARSAVISVSDANQRLLGGLRFEGRYEWSSSHLSMGLLVLVDVAFVRTHYDVTQTDGTTATVASVWPFRPGAAVALGIR